MSLTGPKSFFLFIFLVTLRQGDSWKLLRESSYLYLLSVFSNSGASRNSLSRHNQITALKKKCSVNPWLIAVALRPKGGQPVPPTARLEWLHPHLLPHHWQLPPRSPPLGLSPALADAAGTMVIATEEGGEHRLLTPTVERTYAVFPLSVIQM